MVDIEAALRIKPPKAESTSCYQWLVSGRGRGRKNALQARPDQWQHELLIKVEEWYTHFALPDVGHGQNIHIDTTMTCMTANTSSHAATQDQPSCREITLNIIFDVIHHISSYRIIYKVTLIIFKSHLFGIFLILPKYQNIDFLKLF